MESQIIDTLKKAGWYPNRIIKIDSDIEILEKRGYILSSSFIRFYKEFGNLFLDIDVNENNRKINFDIKEAIRYDYDDVIIEDYPKLIGCQSIIPIGNIDGSSYLAIDELDNVYAFSDGNVMKIGIGKEAVNYLLIKPWREFEELPIPNWW